MSDATAFPPARYQTFDVRTDPATVAPRFKALREEMARSGLDGFLVPRADVHRGESVPPSEARLAFVTGFTGSAGMAVIGKDKAALFVDSRYTLQAPLQTDTSLVNVVETTQSGLNPEIADFVPEGGRLGYDPWLHTPSEIRKLAERLGDKVRLVATANLVDRIWADRPAPPATPIEVLGHNRAGKSSADKLAELREVLGAAKADALVLTVPESINWLFNIRARDVPNVPVALCFALVKAGGKPVLYLPAARVDSELRAALGDTVEFCDTAELIGDLRQLGAADSRVMIDPASAPQAVATAITGAADAVLVERPDPVTAAKAKKNEAELAGMREAHRLDGVALAKFLCWFDSAAPKGGLDEIGIVTALEAFRREEETLVDASFDTISGAGAHGAIVHYRVDENSNRKLVPGELMLIDSGAQYLAGTTDITRTLFTGSATAEQKDRYTRVLKGMIALTLARYPKGTTGAQLDVLARQYLWADGVTYNHGTGHGVGAFLSVHEGPTGFAPRYTVPIEAGMIISNEPGYYKAGEYGIRIENLVHIVESADFPGYLEHETLTLAPIDLRLVDESLLLPHERDWLNRFHKRVWTEIGPLVSGEVKAWLENATRAI